ncbi:hypothetical protein KC19_VG295700 [Ceratodon purpureus]|uniref:Secreted protein n=1 Tax=Ceratodon purpureus TaxID=3225 RepID=A0A8T0HVV0_CERPU|nr:hypothetical protein KC19_VG295700 [Ceratodon purpureus]
MHRQCRVAHVGLFFVANLVRTIGVVTTGRLPDRRVAATCCSSCGFCRYTHWSITWAHKAEENHTNQVEVQFV